MTRNEFQTFLFTLFLFKAYIESFSFITHNYVRMGHSNRIDTLYREINYSSMNDEKNVYCNKP